MPIQILTVLPHDALAIQQARGLFEEYWTSFGFTPCFQNFGAELESLPGRFQAPTGELVLARDSDSGEPIGVIAYHRWDDTRCEAKRLYVKPLRVDAASGCCCCMRWPLAPELPDTVRSSADTMPAMQDALTLYARMGFEQTAPYSDNPTAGAIYLRYRL